MVERQTTINIDAQFINAKEGMKSNVFNVFNTEHF